MKPAAPTEPKRVRRDRRRPATRQRIIDATLALLLEGGTRSLNKTAICKRAGIQYSVIYAHFDDVDACVAAAAEQLAQHLSHRDAALRRALADRNRPTLASLEAAVTAILEAYLEDPDTARFICRYRNEDSPVGVEIRRSLDRSVDMILEDTLATAQALGIRSPPLDDLRFCSVQSVDALLNSLALLLDNPRQDRQALARRTAHWIHHGIAARMNSLLAEQGPSAGSDNTH